MTQQKKYVWLRNIALLSICGYLCHSIFPIPPITWRLLFLGAAFLAIVPNLSSLTRLEKTVLIFWGFHLVYFFTSYFWLNAPSTTLIGNVSVSLFAIPLFMTLGRKGVMTSRFYLISTIILLVSALFYYSMMKAQVIGALLRGEDATINASTIFLYILPLIFVLKKRYLSYSLLLVCVYFILDAAKRGNIVCAVPVIFLYIIFTFHNKQVNFYEKVIFMAFFLCAILWGLKQYEKNEYLQERMEYTMAGNSSGRDELFEKSWKVYSESQYIKNTLFGYGFQATYYNKQIGNYAHNDWLEILVDYGAIGALLYFYIFVLLFVMIKKEKNIQKRYVLISIVTIWFLKTIFSMSYTVDITYTLFLLLGYVSYKTDSHNSNPKIY